jgi:branched-subunit amino acid transport protein
MNAMFDCGWTPWLIIAGMATVTYLNRATFLLLPPGTRLPEPVQRALRFAPASALSAIVLPDLLSHGGHFDLSLDNLRLYAGAAGFAVALVARSTLFGIVAGMAALHALLRVAGGV